MYLKSLVLKGFKSFADRSVLEFEPGITAIVGPNGSGKSNISDSVLWVLGERSAKNLRGQAMEDVIFAGSSARKPVGVSEVELVLDNSDHTLPVDFTEVSIARRMYRNGESEYLINGSLVRRMDVLDVLHDTGLGTGTHSIISQGSLDAILQSKPEDRRALVEEAAGVLKHKQRKARSENKLEQIDQHLARVKDVAAEIERQLKPLERKAKRAQAYEGLACELADLNLALAVDDLRLVQKKWLKAGNKEEELQSHLKEAEKTIGAVESRMQQIQEDIQKRSLDAGGIAQQLRRASSALERAESRKLFLQEKKRAARDYTEEMRLSLSSTKLKLERAESAGSEAHERLMQTSEERRQAQALMDDVSGKHKTLQKEVHTLQSTIDACKRSEFGLSKEIEQLRLDHNESLKVVSAKRAQEEIIQGRCLELEAHITGMRKEFEAATQLAVEQKELCDKLAEEERGAKESLATSFAQREHVRKDLEKTYEDCSNLRAQIKALEELERVHQRENPALLWVLEHAHTYEYDMSTVAKMLEVPRELEGLVERVLGADLDALFVEDIETAGSIASHLMASNTEGEVSLLPRQKLSSMRQAPIMSHKHALSNLISYPEYCRDAVEMLLGDVVVCENRDEALREHLQDKLGLRFATLDGMLVWPDSKVTLDSGLEGKESILARLRQLAEIRAALNEMDTQHQKLEESKSLLDQELQQAQKRSLQASEDLAKIKGDYRASESELSRLKDKLAATEQELEAASKELLQARLVLEEAQPGSKNIETLLAEKQAALEACLQNKSEALVRVAPFRSNLKELEDRLTEARLKAGTLIEWENYAQRMLESAQEDTKHLEKELQEIRSGFVRKWVSSKRSESLIAVFDPLINNLRVWTNRLERETHEAQSSSSDLHGALSSARAQARQAQNAYDEIHEQMSGIKVEKGRLELQVESALESIVADANVPLEKALELEALENRAEVEDAKFHLERKIKNMGTINPDAALEYGELKKRYDYIASQLEDISNARSILDRIVRVIDTRMKHDFMRTFDEVNSHFKEIFSVLFPGGSAELILADPDDVEHTGVEVRAQPRGKRITKMMLLSGGEKSLTALSLLFAVYRTKTTPFYILDEVEAALDDTNLRRLTAYLDKLRDSTQLILITHQRRTMEMADALYGTSMQADGVTRVVSQKLERRLKQVEEKV